MTQQAQQNEEECEDLRRQLENSEKELDAANSAQTLLQESTNQYGMDQAGLVDGLEADVAAGAAALQAKDGELILLQQQLAEMQKQLEEANTAQSLLQESITQSDSDHAAVVDGLEADVAAGAAALQAKDGELSMLQQQLAEMQKQLEEARINQAATEAAVSTAHDESANVAQLELMLALDEASKDLQEKDALVDGLEADVAAGAAALQAKDAELSLLQQQLADMQKQLEEALILLQAKLREALANSQAKDMQLSCIQQELAALEQQVPH